MADPRQRDPRFPDRPQHEDFYLLSEVVQENDRLAEQASADVFKIAGVDQASAIYMIQGRLDRFLDSRGAHRTQAVLVPSMGMWLDGFAAGVAFNQRRTGELESKVANQAAETGTAGEGSSS